MQGRIQRPKADGDKWILPRAGFIKTGYKDDKGFPRSVDYFIASGKYAKYFTDAYPGKPQTLHVVFLSDDPMDSCAERFEYRDKDGRLYAFGDGVNFEYWDKEKYNPTTIEQIPDIQERIANKVESKRGWEITLSLKFLLPKIRGIAGYWQFNTRGAQSTIPHIIGAFDSILENRGFIRGVIFDLNVEFAKSQKPGSKSRYPVVTLVPNVSEENVKMMKEAFLKSDTTKLLSDDSIPEGKPQDV